MDALVELSWVWALPRDWGNWHKSSAVANATTHAACASVSATYWHSKLLRLSEFEKSQVAQRCIEHWSFREFATQR